MSGKLLTNNLNQGDKLLNAGETGVTSAIFRVKSVPVRLVAYNLSPEDKVIVYRVLLPSDSPQRTPCGQYVGQSILAEQVHHVGSRRVELSATRPEVVIDATGDFKVVYQGENREEVIIDKLEEHLTRTENNMR